MNIFDVVGDEFFKPLTGIHKNIYYDCLSIIYQSYRTELSYGIDRDILIAQLSDYFEQNNTQEIQTEEDSEILNDSRTKATTFLRNLKRYGWIESEFSNDRKEKILMPGHAVTMMQTVIALVNRNETEYQSEISAIYSILINEELLARPYPQIIMPVYDATVKLFSELKKLNTDIRKYIDELTDGRTAEEIMKHFFGYNEQIASKSYHRLHTSENVTRFRNTIINRLNMILSDSNVMRNAALGYQNIEDTDNYDEALEKVQRIITDIIGYFRSYDEIIGEIDKKHSRYLGSAVNRARLAFLSTNNMEGKVSAVLRMLADDLNHNPYYSPEDIADDDVCRAFNLFPQSFLDSDSLNTVAVSKKITNVEEIAAPVELSVEEREKRRQALLEKNKNRFSKKNINDFVLGLLKDKTSIKASDIPLQCKRDMIRLVFINMYGRDKRSMYIIIPTDEEICKNDFSFRDFTIKRRLK